jgi:ubiquinone/menaquinone biosynthesis C-methylase UbiE
MAVITTDDSILILYTTRYRTGGEKFARAAETLRAEKSREFVKLQVICQSIEGKKDFLQEVEKISSAGKKIREFHFIGHSGVYGIMFGTTQWPEQFSPFEWKNMSMPFTDDGHFYFHACRTGRWFAPFIARTLGVRTSGHYWYTTISKSPRKFRWEGFAPKKEQPLYIISCPGKKSHGFAGSLLKYSGFAKALPLREFAPSDEPVDTTYDSVATLYDDTFDDVAVRKDEWQWLTKTLGRCEEKSILDIGCGNGAFLQKLSGRIGRGQGVDISAKMLDQARKRCAQHPHISFEKLDGPALPFADNSFDIVMSVLSFRYLDWDPILQEILRVLKPGGELVVIDMVAAPVKPSELTFFLKSKLTYYFQKLFHRSYYSALKKMVTNANWKTMLKFNPMRSEHEMKWFLESRFPGHQIEIINIGWNSRILAFRSGPVDFKSVEKMVYP